MHLADPSIFEIKVPRTLNPEAIDDLQNQWECIDFSQCCIVLLRGGKDGFCLGMDLNWLTENDVNQVDSSARQFGVLLQSLQMAPCITVAVVDGATAGGGLGICAACDIVLADTNSSFRLSEGLLGLVPGIILSALLKRMSRQTIAKMVFTAKTLTAKDALTIGLIDAWATDGELEDLVQRWLLDLKQCKRQSVADLKVLLEQSKDAEADLTDLGARLLMQRLRDPQMQTRLSNLAFFNQV